MAATTVLVVHQFVICGYSDSPLLKGARYSLIAVTVFFVISGYLITKSWIEDPVLWRFILKRLLRILPALIFVTLITIFIMGPLTTTLSLGEYFTTRTTWQYLHNIHLKMKYVLPGVFLSNPYPRSVNGSLWTLPVEFKWYLIVALLGVSKLIRIKAVPIVCMLILAWWIYSFSQPGVDELDYFWYFGLFFLEGMILTSVELSKKVLLIIFLLSLLFSYLNYWFIASVLFLPVSVIYFGRESFPIIRSVSRFGDLSYGVYIFAFPTQQTIVHFLGASTPFVLLMAYALISTYFLAYLSWNFIESPALSLKKYLYSPGVPQPYTHEGALKPTPCVT